MSIYENKAQTLIKKRNDAKQLIEHTEIRLNESEKMVELQTKLAESGKENTLTFEKSQLAKIQLELRRAKELLSKINNEIETQNLSANIKFISGTNFNAKTIEEAIQEAINNGLIEKENKNFDRINESIYTDKFNTFLQEIKGLDWENEAEYIKLISEYFSEFLKHNKEIERLKFLARENDRIKNIAKDQKEAEEKSPLLEIAVKLTGYGGYNLHTTTQPVFYFIKDVLKEYNLNPTEAIDIINDMQGSFIPQFNTNATPKIIAYLKEIPKEFYNKKQPPPDKLSLREIALLYYFKGEKITIGNQNTYAKKHQQNNEAGKLYTDHYIKIVEDEKHIYQHRYSKRYLNKIKPFFTDNEALNKIDAFILKSM
jgi:hypothetical protein